MIKISVLGTGSWGSAIGDLLNQNGHEVIMWQRDAEKVKAMEVDRKHPFFVDLTFSDEVKFTTDLDSAIKGSQLLVVAVPSHSVRELVSRAVEFIEDNVIIVNITKGLELDTLLTMSSVIS